MAAIKQLPVPRSLADLLRDPHRVADAYELLNLLLALQVQLTTPESTRGRSSLSVAGENIILPIPLKFTSQITAASGGSVIDVNLRAKFTELLAQLTLVGMNPS